MDPTKPVGYINAYWPNHKVTDPETRIVRLSNPKTGLTYTYEAIYKDPKDNTYDLSSPESWDAIIAQSQEKPEGYANWDMAAKGQYFEKMMKEERTVMFSAYSDEDDNVLYQVVGEDIPTSAVHEKMHMDKFTRGILSLLDPNTPGLEDIKDPFSALAQDMLNDIAMRGPSASEDAKKDEGTIRMLHGLYEASGHFEELMADLDESVAEEEAEAAASGKMLIHRYRSLSFSLCLPSCSFHSFFLTNGESFI